MLDVVECLKDTLFFFEDELEKSLPIKEIYLGSDMFSRSSKDKVTVYYLESSNQIEIPGSYLNLFLELNRKEGDQLRGLEGGGLQEFISLGINLPGMLLYRTDARGIRSILGKMVTIGTSEIRKIVSKLKPWIISNINNTLEI